MKDDIIQIEKINEDQIANETKKSHEEREDWEKGVKDGVDGDFSKDKDEKCKQQKPGRFLS